MRVSRASEMEDGTGFPVKGFCTIPGGVLELRNGPSTDTGFEFSVTPGESGFPRVPP